MAIDTLESSDILTLCNAVKTSVSIYVARMTRSLCGRIFRYAVICGYISFDSSRDWRTRCPLISTSLWPR